MPSDSARLKDAVEQHLRNYQYGTRPYLWAQFLL